MRNQRKFKKRKSEFLSIIEKHIKTNAREYIVVTIALIVGIVIGVIMVNTSSNQNKEDISGYINGFVESVKQEEYTIDGTKMLEKSIVSNIKIAAIIWIAGLTVIGIPFIYLSAGYKGIRIGYTIASVIATLGRAKGLVFSLSTMLPQNLIALPCILALAVSSEKMYKRMVKNKTSETVKTEIIRHTLFSFIMTIGLIISSIIEYVFTISFFRDIIINFV